MARGNRILVTSNPAGKFQEFFIKTGETPKPGTIVQIDASVALASGHHTCQVYSRDADGDRPKGAFWVLQEDAGRGKTATDAYAAGDLALAYAPEPGEEINLLFLNEAGTADDIALGDQLVVDSGTGKVYKSADTPETEVACALEAIVDPVADQLLWCAWSGH